MPQHLEVNRLGLLPLLRRQHYGLEAIYHKPRTSIPNPKAKKYPYLLRDKEVEYADEVWCADITYIRRPKGFAYLVVVMDWRTRAGVSWKLSNTLDVGFCMEAFRTAGHLAGCVPEIFNTDQGCQFPSDSWAGMLESAWGASELGWKGALDGSGVD